jgi:hypothetical protein
MLKDLAPKNLSCKIKIVTGEEIEIFFRPFTLKDLAWNQEQFDTDEKRVALAELRAEPICKIIWHMLTPETKENFSSFTFIDYDEVNEVKTEKKVIGYEKLLHLFYSQEEMLKAFIAYSQLESLNNFLPDIVKKKISKAQSLIG